MSGFRAVNTQLALAEPHRPAMEDPIPTTPRAFVADTTSADPLADELSAKTPTRDTFKGMAAQKPLPELPTIVSTGPQESTPCDVKPETQSAEGLVKTEESGQDVEMTDSGDVKDGSEPDSADGDSGRPSKKKKGQRFFCTDFPPCQLSFTRSEHLARHIRKHTGERPFQCHCNRRFSRLDNLRQHAQTVHVNEDIPIDSLAATGTRFQRQIRTDRVRPANRSRASTFSNSPNPVHAHRGHSRNLSSSSVTSISSVSTFGGDDIRRAVHGFETPRTNRLSLDTYVPTSTPNNAQAMQPYYTVGTNSPTGYSTPTSASFSVGNSSPRYSSGLHSPAATASRGLYWGSKTPSRRLSVPGSNPFQSAQSPDTQTSSYMSPVPSNAAVARTSNYINTPSGSSTDSRRESMTDQEWRRRTWHPNTDTQLRTRPATSHVTPQYIADLPRPVFPSQPSQASTTRLPGIHTFDQPPPPPSTLLNGARPPSPMQIDPAPTSHPAEQQPTSATESTNNRNSWTSGLQTEINRLEITNKHKPQDLNTWNPANSNAQATEAQTTQARGHVRQHSDESPITPRRNKRMGWYMQPPAHVPSQSAQRPSPDSISSDGAPTPVATVADYHPTIVHSNGHQEPHGPNHMQGVEEQAKPAPPPAPVYQPVHHVPQVAIPTQNQGRPFTFPKAYEPPVYSPLAERGDLRRLEALVAVATSEEQRI